MELMQSLDTVRHLPRVLTYLPKVVIGLVLFLWAAIIIFRKWFDRDRTMPGAAPSWWSPLGLEWLLHSTWDPKQTPIGEAVVNLFDYYTDLYSKGEGIVRGFVLMVPAVLVYKADGMEGVLSSNRLINKGWLYSFLHSWLGTGLLTGDGNKWRQRRKMLTPAFHFRILEDFLPLFDEHARHFTQILKQHEGGKPVEISSLVTKATLDIICETAMGVKINAQQDTGSGYVKAINTVGGSFIKRIAKPWHWLDITYYLSADGRRHRKNLNILHGFTRKVIEERKDEMLKEREDREGSSKNDEAMGVKKRRPFLDLLLETHLEDPQLLSLEGIREEVDTFMFEGHDTTAMGISWALYLLAENPEIQAKAHQEIDDIFGEDHDRAITHEDLLKMKYIECCIKEAQRLFPSVPFIARFIHEDSVICGHKVKAWTFVLLNIFRAHRDPDVFPDPEKFDPDRFLPANSIGRSPFAYVPFSAGPRNCIGQKFAQMELKVMVARTLRKYRLRSALPRKDLHIVGELVTRSRDGLSLYIESRQ